MNNTEQNYIKAPVGGWDFILILKVVMNSYLIKINGTLNRKIRGPGLPQKQRNVEIWTYFLRWSARELLLVWANMSKSSWLRPGREDKVPLTLSEATSGETVRE